MGYRSPAAESRCPPKGQGACEGERAARWDLIGIEGEAVARLIGHREDTQRCPEIWRPIEEIDLREEGVELAESDASAGSILKLSRRRLKGIDSIVGFSIRPAGVPSYDASDGRMRSHDPFRAGNTSFILLGRRRVVIRIQHFAELLEAAGNERVCKHRRLFLHLVVT